MRPRREREYRERRQRPVSPLPGGLAGSAAEPRSPPVRDNCWVELVIAASLGIERVFVYYVTRRSVRRGGREHESSGPFRTRTAPKFASGETTAFLFLASDFWFDAGAWTHTQPSRMRALINARCPCIRCFHSPLPLCSRVYSRLVSNILDRASTAQ